MASGQNNNGGSLSFGVEMEFWVFYVTEDQGPVVVPNGMESHPGKPIYIRDTPHRAYEVEKSLKTRIRDFVQTLPLATVLPPGINTSIADMLNADALHLRHYRQWNVEDDLTLDHLPPELEAVSGPSSGWVGVEVISPALWATDDGFDQVRKVCEFINNNFWTYTHPIAGLHIHVGNGKKYFPNHSLRQIAALLYAADPILAQAHPEHRHNNGFCPSLRLCSKLSLGETANGAAAPLEQLNAPTDSSLFKIRSFFRSLFGRRPPHPRTRRHAREREMDGFPPRPKKPMFVPNSQRDPADRRASPSEAFGILMGQTSRKQICTLMTTSILRPAYSFHDSDLTTKRTIEFRRPASSVDPAEVVAQARIAVALCEFAANPDEERFHKIILDCDTADEHPGWYDVYDLLLDLDLRPEARVVHAALKGTLNESVRKEYWSSRRFPIENNSHPYTRNLVNILPLW
ncbi:putative amidoligase enzyme-domain-containing protein [Hypoxylon sp. FL0543]|nr:putative amidoligase enzyme-domain-containing protein [Hypoxylon sp. FL0543]